MIVIHQINVLIIIKVSAINFFFIFTYIIQTHSNFEFHLKYYSKISNPFELVKRYFPIIILIQAFKKLLDFGFR